MVLNKSNFIILKGVKYPCNVLLKLLIIISEKGQPLPGVYLIEGVVLQVSLGVI